MSFVSLLKRVEKVTIDNSPAILTAFGIVGTIATAYLTGKATFKAAEIIEKEHWDRNRHTDHFVPMDMKERTKVVWKLYIPPAVSAAFTVTAIFGANHISSRRATAMATAFSISERAFSEYKEKVIEKIGEKKERDYRDEIAQDRVNKNPPDDRQVIITGDGDVLCYDHFTGRYFTSNMEALRKAENEINHLILSQGYASVSDFYHEIGLPPTAFSEEVGWNTNKLLELVFSTTMSPDGRPCIAIDFDLHPNRKYAHFAGE